MAGIGHNSGREAATGWRRFAWREARGALLPKLPVEVVRLRVKRAKELGLPYKTYAGVRASTGHDLIGFLFSNNALRVVKAGQTIPEAREIKLASLVRTERIGLVHAPLSPSVLAKAEVIDRAVPAPAFQLSWSEMRANFRTLFGEIGQPGDRFIIVGDQAIERDWVPAAQAAGYLSSDEFFALP